MMKRYLILLLLTALQPVAWGDMLRISDNHRYIVSSDGRPFLWLGDTAWELFHRLDRDEADVYLSKRAEQGFTVIQAVILAENDGLRTPNPYGEIPLKDLSPDQPNEAYFEHVDYIVRRANALGMVMGMLPTWGDKVESAHPGAGPIVFDAANAERYGEFLGRRYRDDDVVWILGGDRNVASEDVLETWRAMARGLERGDGGRHLTTYHPRGGSSSSYWLHNEEWLDFNMYQSGHTRHFEAVYDMAEADSLRRPAKPTLDGEPAYEDIPVKFWEYCDWTNSRRAPDAVLDSDLLISNTSHFPEGYFTDYDVRVHAYWDFLSGACGYTYGNNAVWQMFKKGGPIAIPCLTDWRVALDRPGAQDIRHLRTLFESRSFAALVPDQSIVYGANPKGKVHVRAAQAADQSFILVYLALGQPVHINMGKMNHAVQAAWFDPRRGETLGAGTFENTGIVRFTPPTSGDGNDWLLILDDAAARDD